MEMRYKAAIFSRFLKFQFGLSKCFLLAIALPFIISSCRDGCNEKYDKSTCKRVREKSSELNRKATNYARQKDKLILDYHIFIHGYNQSHGHASDSIDVYLDRTIGMDVMIKAFGQDNTWTSLINSLIGRKANWNEVYGSKNPEDFVKSLTRPPRFDELINEEYYKEYGSPLDSAFSMIVRNKNRQSIFITDGELARDGHSFLRADGKTTIINQKEAWAKEMIDSWLMDGSVIDVLLRPYYRPYAQDTMRGFVFVFTPASLVNDPGNIKNIILNNLRTKERDNLHHLRFGYYDHSMSRIEPPAGSAGEVINRNFTDKHGGNSIRRSVHQEKRFEHLHFNLPVDDFRKFFYTWINWTEDRLTREPIKTHKLFDNLGFINNYLVFDSIKLGLRVYNLDLAIDDFILMKKTEWADTIETEQWGTIYCIEDFDFPNERPDFRMATISPLVNCFSIGFPASVNQVGLLYQKYSVNAFSRSGFNFRDFQASNSFRIDFVIEDFSHLGNGPSLSLLKWNNHIFSDPVNDGVYRSFLNAFTENQRFIREKPVYTIYLTFN
jgi:hypothetical protein